MDAGIDAKKDVQEEIDSASIREGLRRLSVSPPRHRTDSPSTWRACTPPPPPFFPVRPRVETPTPQVQSGLPRTFSSPSLMDSSPKTRSPAAMSSKRANELTPITRNTTSSFVDDGHAVVSPDDGMEDLIGEHLAMPTASFAEACLKRRASGSGAPSLPPLRPMSERAKSMTSTLQQQQQHEHDDYVPIDFPSERKYCHYSFTSHEQFTESTYSQQLLHNARHPAGLVPYQPPREDGNVGSFSDSVLGGIFQESIPLEDRQCSIPSIHLAHHLNGSTTSYTDEEDDLQRTFDDEGSLSSRGSSLYLPGEDAEDSGEETGGMAKLRLNVSASKMTFHAPEKEETPKVAFRALSESHDSDNDADEEEEASKKRVKKRTKRKERQAMDWLRSVESTNEAISEAASSKFLTSTAQVAANRRRSYLRNTSSPLEEHQYSGPFPPPSDTFPPPTTH